MHANRDKTQQDELLSGNALQEAPPRRPLLKAVVLYSDLESGVNGKILIDRVAKQAGWPGTTKSLFWRFDVMTQSQVAREALYGAADADIVLLVAKGLDAPPGWLLEWLEIWAITRRIQDATLAAWCRGHGVARYEKSVGPLRDLARRYGLKFFCAEEVGRNSG